MHGRECVYMVGVEKKKWPRTAEACVRTCVSVFHVALCEVTMQ